MVTEEISYPRNQKLKESNIKTLIWVIIAAVLVLSLVYTNPSQNEYDQFLKYQITKQVSKESGDSLSSDLSGLFTQLLGSSVIDSVTHRQNFVLFSVYSTSGGNNTVRFIGIMGNFVPITNNISQSLSELTGSDSDDSTSSSDA